MFLKPPELIRSVRMRDPDEEERALDRLVQVDVLVIDDLGIGADTPYSRQILQEVLDRRSYRDRGGLIITTKYSLDQLATKLGDDSIPSRLAGMSRVIAVGGRDHRLMFRNQKKMSSAM
jgi:DNA replication protein DnaC